MCYSELRVTSPLILIAVGFIYLHPKIITRVRSVEGEKRAAAVVEDHGLLDVDERDSGRSGRRSERGA